MTRPVFMRISALTLVLAALDGCGEPSHPSAREAVVTSTPSPTQMTSAEAKAILEPLFNARDEAIGHWNEAGPSGSLKRLNRTAGEAAKATDTLARTLVAHEWPATITDDVAKLVDALNAEYPVIYQLSEINDLDDIGPFFNDHWKPIAADVPAAMRALEVKLGIKGT